TRKGGDDVIRSLSGALDDLTGSCCKDHRKPLGKASGDCAGLILVPQVRKQHRPHWARFEPKHTRLYLSLDGERVAGPVLRDTRWSACGQCLESRRCLTLVRDAVGADPQCSRNRVE